MDERIHQTAIKVTAKIAAIYNKKWHEIEQIYKILIRTGSRRNSNENRKTVILSKI